MPLVAELTAPALFVAGASTSLHCALMCGAINAAQVRSHGPVPLRQALLLVHGGRVLGYALLGALAGALAGALGARLALWLPDALAGRALQGLAALTLVAAGAQQLKGDRLLIAKRDGLLIAGNPVRRCAAHSARSLSLFGLRSLSPFVCAFGPRARLLAQGLLWALMPCGILYTVVLLAALSASPLAGFGLLAAFGLGTVPLMGVSGGLLGLATRPRDAKGLRHAAGAALVTLGLAGLALAALSPDGLAELLCAR
jgi:sulfite exporter TauE/SafE